MFTANGNRQPAAHCRLPVENGPFLFKLRVTSLKARIQKKAAF